MVRAIIFFIGLILLPEIFLGQSLNAPLRFTNYTVEDGLPSNKVNDIMHDSRGFVWMSTAQGLARFDGNKFTVYNHKRADSNSMPYDDVGNCIELNNHELIFECNSKMWMLNPMNGEQHPPPSFWSSKSEARPKKISNHLIGIKSQGKFYFTDFNLNVIDSIYLPELRDFGLPFYLGDNRVLFTNNHLLFCYSISNKKMEEWKFDRASFYPPIDLYVKDVDTMNQRIYIGGYASGVYTMKYDISAPDYLKGLKQPIPYISAVTDISYKNEAIIIPGNYGLTIKQAGKPAIVLTNIHGEPASILPGVLNRVFAGNDGQYWIAGENGVSHFDLNQINYKFWKLSYPAIINFYNKNNDGKIWMSTEHYGTMAIDTKTDILQVIDSSIIRYCWGAMPIDNQIYLYGNSTPGKYANGEKFAKLLAYNSTTNKITTPTFIQPFLHGAELITLVYKSKNGDIWYSINEGNGLVRQKSGKNDFTQYRSKDIPSPFLFRYLNKAAEDKSGNIYFTVNYNNAVLVWKNSEQKFETWRMDSLLGYKDMQFGPIFNHIIDRRQNLWIIYPQTGLIKYNLETKKAKLYESEDGLPYNSFDNLVADANDNIWFPTPKGMCCLLAATDKFITFTEKDGLPFTDFSNSYLFLDRDDSSIYFSNPGYLYRINTYNLLSRKKQIGSKLFIEAMQVNAKPYYFTDEKNIQLAATENNLSFNFELLDLAQNIQQKNIEYLLIRNNKKSEWQKLNGITSIAFTAMQPGSYTLQVRLLNEATGKNIFGSNPFTFTIATPWSKSWWFITLVFLLIMLAVWAFIKAYYLRRIEKQKLLIDRQTELANERNRIATDMHDDLGAGLSRIRYMSTGMKNEIKDEGLKKDFDKIITGSDELVDKMNEIIWALNRSDEKLADVLYYIRSQCGEMLDGAGITLQATLPESIPEKILNSEEKRNLFLVVKEAVHNIIKHAHATTVNIVMQIDKNLCISIIDDGKGFNLDESRIKGNGLGNYQKRMNSLKGSVDIKSDSTGTRVQFIMPL